jgi:hypothetical protein
MKTQQDIYKRRDWRSTTKHTFLNIRHPVTDVDCLETESKLEAVTTFYSQLYAEERIDTSCLDTIHIDKTISSEDAHDIIEDISFESISIGIYAYWLPFHHLFSWLYFKKK